MAQHGCLKRSVKFFDTNGNPRSCLTRRTSHASQLQALSVTNKNPLVTVNDYSIEDENWEIDLSFEGYF